MSEQAEAAPGEQAEPPEPQAEEGAGLDAESLEGHKLDDMGGAQVGRIASVLGKDESGDAEWLIARMGRFGHYCLVPAGDAVAINGRVWVPYTRDQIRRAPRVDPSGPPPEDVARATTEHYGLA